MLQVFISYRRNDSFADAILIHQHLKSAFGTDVLFLDIETLGAGVKFIPEILEAVNACQALIAIIGKQWLSMENGNGKRRIDDPDDILRMEIATALERDIRVIPVMVGGATMPLAKDLPANLRPLAERNALTISYSSFDHDIGKLIEAIRQTVGNTTPNTNGEPQNRELIHTVQIPSPESLAEFFGFTLEDLELNRKGIISQAQVTRLRSSALAELKSLRKLSLWGVGLTLLGLVAAPDLKFSGIQGLIGAPSLFIGVVLLFICVIIFLASIWTLLDNQPSISTAVGILGYYTSGHSITIGQERLHTLVPIHRTPNSPPAGLIYYVYHTRTKILSVELSNYVPI